MKIAVAMSGGVDSSVAAVLLKNEKHEIIGVTMKHYDPQATGFPINEGIDAAIRDAKKVCEKLEIEHIVIDTQKEFKDMIISNFIDEYKWGRTPNPCTLCNPMIKWGVFKDKVMKLGVEKIATGHYLKLHYKNGKYHLYKADDKDRDQSYMLWRLNQKQLSETLFPLASYTKNEIRRIADKYDLHVANKKDSQEICFIYGSYKRFLEEHLPPQNGDIIFKNGKKIGEHSGIVNYTIGQRKGLNTPWTDPLFVKYIDVKNNSIVVTDNQNELLNDSFQIKDINWISGDYPADISNLEVQIRYNSKPVPVKEILKNNSAYRVILIDKIRAITPGQSAVFYYKNELLGGGIII